jgi:hypothetical protein
MGGVEVAPLPTGVTAPRALSIVNEVAFAVVHVSVPICPLAVVTVGETESEQEGPTLPPPPPPPAVTVALQVTVPPAPVAVPVKVVSVVMVAVVVVPLTTGVSAPIELSIENVLAFVVVHERTLVPEEPTSVGFAVSVQVGAGGGGGVVVTAIVAVQWTVPPVPVAVSVYVVVEAGETGVEPFTATEPMLLSRLTEVALVVVHVSVEELPVWIAVGFAESVQVGAEGGGGGGGVVVTVIVAAQCATPPAPVAVPS